MRTLCPAGLPQSLQSAEDVVLGLAVGVLRRAVPLELLRGACLHAGVEQRFVVVVCAQGRCNTACQPASGGVATTPTITHQDSQHMLSVQQLDIH